MSKYGAIRTTVDGITFDSKGESIRYQQLKLLEAAGEIRDLKRQIKYPLVVNGVKIADYVADFRYVNSDDGAVVVEDFKSKATITPVYRLKKKFMLAIYGITILETHA